MFISGMNIIKWKLKIKNIGGIQRIQIFSLNSNKLINIVNEETEIFFYTLIDQKKVLVKIDENHFDIDTNTTSYKYEDNSIVKAILFYNIENTYKYNTEQQNIIEDRFIYSRKYCSLIPEYLNRIEYIIIRDVLNNKYFGNESFSMIFTYFFAYFVKSNLSSFLIKSFIQHYSINESKFIVNGPSFNDFFIRELKVPLDIIKNSKIIYAPVSARTMFYNYKNFYKLKLHIKGKHFSLAKLIDEENISLKYSVIIARLAVNDYHHMHMPEDGILMEVKEFNGKYVSVDRDYLRSDINVLNENKRVVFKFKRDDDSIFYLVMIGSILISSIMHNTELFKKYYTKEKIAYFQYGGSCVVYVSDKNIYFDDDLIYFTNENIESYVKVGEEIGNIKKQKHKEFNKNYHIKKHIIGTINQLIYFIVKLMIKINKNYLSNLNIELV